MIRPQLKLISWVLVAAVLVMLGATTGAAFAHEIQHAAHHNAGMHSSGICAWMCATAGSLNTSAIQPPQFELVFAAVSLSAPVLISRDGNLSPLPRAPPFLS